MTIKYDVVANPLKPHSYYPRVVPSDRILLQRLIDDIVSETTLTETDVRAVINALKRRVAAYLLDGQNVDIEGLVCFSTSMSEQLPNASAGVSKDAVLRVNARPAAELQKQLRAQAQIERTHVRQRLPILSALFDVATQAEGTYTPGSIARLLGDDLKFDAMAEDEGVFFIDVDSDPVIRVRTYAHLGIREVIFLVPADVQNCQYVELRTRFGSEKTLRVGRMPTSVSQNMPFDRA